MSHTSVEFPGQAPEFPGSKPTGRKESRSALVPSRCFVKTRCGAIVREGAGFGSAMVAELPHRVVVSAVGVAENANGARVRIAAPVNGWLSFKNVELYPSTAPAPVEEAATEADQRALDEDRAAASEAAALAKLAEDEGGFSDTDSFDSDASSYEVLDEADGDDGDRAPFVAASSFAGFRAGYFFGSRDGRLGYFRDGDAGVTERKRVPEAVDGARGEPYKVVGLLGLKVRQGPELYSAEVAVLPEGCEVRALETCVVTVADMPTPGDPWAKAAHLYRDKRVTRARVDRPADDTVADDVRGWVTLSETLVCHVDLRTMVDKKRLRECLRRLERGGGVGDATESRRRGRNRVRHWPTSKAPISVVFHSFRLILGRAIISRSGPETRVFFFGNARARGTPTSNHHSLPRPPRARGPREPRERESRAHGRRGAEALRRHAADPPQGARHERRGGPPPRPRRHGRRQRRRRRRRLDPLRPVPREARVRGRFDGAGDATSLQVVSS